MRLSTSLLILSLSCATLACGPRNRDKLDDNELATAQGGKAAATDDRCAAQVTQDEVRRQLFARAAQIRGSNGDNYVKIASFSVLQLDGAAPVATVAASELIDCRGHATLRLPAGLKVAGGRTSLGGDIGFTISPGPNGSVTLGQSDAIAIPLATLTQNRSARAAPAPTAPTAPPVAESREPGPVAAPAPEPRPAPAEAISDARPSFNCRRARTQSERAVCADPDLAELDRRMADRYVTALSVAGPDQSELLRTTRDRFLGYRERCRSDDACIANVYRGRLREIGDIMAGRWRGAR